MTASTTKCYREACTRQPELVIWTQHHVHASPHLGVASVEHACEAHAIEDDDAGHVRRAIRLPKE
jgi:hypothetical protein